MKLKLGFMAFLLAMAVSVSGASALDWTQVVDLQQGQGTFAVVSPTNSYENTFEIDTGTVTYQSCHDPDYYQIGSCDFVFKCYIIMPESCTDPSCAIEYDCEEITEIQNPEHLTVNYFATTSDIGKTYAVTAFIMQSHLDYDFSTEVWSDTTTPYDETFMYDYITVEGAPTPTIPNPLNKLGDLINGLLANLRSWICSTIGIWCL